MPSPGSKRISALKTLGGHAVAVLASALCLWLRFALDPLLGDNQPFTLFFPAIACAAAVGGTAPGVLALAITALLGDYFFVQPRRTFLLTESDHLPFVLLFVHCLVGVFLIVIMTLLRRARARTAAALEALRESENRFRVLADSSPNLIWVTDARGGIDFVNERYLQFFGCTLADVRAGGWLPMVHPDDAAAYRATYEEALRRHAVFRAQARVRDAHGHWRWVDSVGLPRFSQNGEFLGHVGSSPDITDVKMVQEILQRVNDELRHEVSERTARLTETLAELEAVSYSLAHDMRSPLITMQGYAELLLEQKAGATDQQTEHYLRRISVGAHRLDRLLKDMLIYAHVGRKELPLGSVDVTKVVLQVMDEHPVVKQHRSAITVAADIPHVVANVAGLGQALACLLDNALKFVADGAPPRVHVEWAQLPSLAGTIAPGRVKIIVRDHGIGIDASGQAQLFKMFQRLHRPGIYEGNGMGLALAKKLVERMGGEIGCESEAGRGSRFWIALPVAQATQVAA